MQVCKSVAEFRILRQAWFRQGYKVGFIPTMGCLHEGHISLVNQAKNHSDKIVVSIFVNPAQFAPTEDLDKYPRTLEADLKVLDGKCDVVVVPTVQDMYPNGITLQVSQQKGAFVTVEGFSHQMEGSIRPHFFRGVATVVSKLFNIVQPDYAFFGQKDVQQCVVIKRMTQDLLFPLKIVVGETIREDDGLAKSSRNIYLDSQQRKYATTLYKALKAIESLYKTGERSRLKLLEVGTKIINEVQEETKGLIQYEYLSLADPLTLEEVERVENGAILSGAIKTGQTRLIDNLLLDYKF